MLATDTVNKSKIKEEHKFEHRGPLKSSLKLKGPTFQNLILQLQHYWGDYGCVIQQPYDVEVGAGTMHPETFLRVLGTAGYKVAYVQPSRRPADGRYGENPNRLFKHHQLQVILKPSPADVQDLYLKSLAAIGLRLAEHDVRFEEDNWESPTLGAWGMGWQVLLDGLEITQFTYFQQSGGIDLDPVSVELTYGLDRICAYLQVVNSVYDVRWSSDHTYGQVRLLEEQEFSAYNFEYADPGITRSLFELHEKEAKQLLDKYRKTHDNAKARYPLLAAYYHYLKSSNLFIPLLSQQSISQ